MDMNDSPKTLETDLLMLGRELTSVDPNHFFFFIKRREVPGASASAEELNKFMAELGYRTDIEDHWIELTPKAAGIYAKKCLHGAWARDSSSVLHIPQKVVQFLGEGTRYFTNGILEKMSEEEIEAPTFFEQLGPDPVNNVYRRHMLSEPFREPLPVKVGANSCNPILPFGLIESGFLAVHHSLLVFLWILIKGDD